MNTNISFLQSLLKHPDFQAYKVSTAFVIDHLEELLKPDDNIHPQLYFADSQVQEPAGVKMDRAGIKVDASDPLAVLNHIPHAWAFRLAP